MDALFQLLKSDANAANAFGAVASAVVAFLALFISALSVYFSHRTLSVQRKHNELSVRPLAEVTVADFENSLRVKVRNNGSGPMIIMKITISNGERTTDTLLEWMPELPNERPWTTFSHSLKNRSLLPGAEITLLELTEFDGESDFAMARDRVRKALAPLSVNVEFMDIYNSIMKPHVKQLNWFGRHSAN
jgi:hypothetical protein